MKIVRILTNMLTVSCLLVGLAIADDDDDSSGMLGHETDGSGILGHETDGSGILGHETDGSGILGQEYDGNGMLGQEYEQPGIPEDMRDPAFAGYVDLGLLVKAWEEKDPVLLTDVALQLAEGERILLRSHKAISADELLGIAVKAAAARQDKKTLERLAKAINNRENKALKAQIAAAVKLGGATRAADPMKMVSVEDMSPAAYEAYRHLVQQAEAAKIGASRESLARIDQAIKDTPGLSDKQREYLLKITAGTRAGIPKDAEPDPAMAQLDKLSAGSRQLSIRQFVPSSVDPFAGRWPKIGGTLEEPSSSVNPQSRYMVRIRNNTNMPINYQLKKGSSGYRSYRLYPGRSMDHTYFSSGGRYFRVAFDNDLRGHNIRSFNLTHSGYRFEIRGSTLKLYSSY